MLPYKFLSIAGSGFEVISHSHLYFIFFSPLFRALLIGVPFLLPPPSRFLWNTAGYYFPPFPTLINFTFFFFFTDLWHLLPPESIRGGDGDSPFLPELRVSFLFRVPGPFIIDLFLATIEASDLSLSLFFVVCVPFLSRRRCFRFAELISTLETRFYRVSGQFSSMIADHAYFHHRRGPVLQAW